MLVIEYLKMYQFFCKSNKIHSLNVTDIPMCENKIHIKIVQNVLL